jgi:sec-independent protein translocase protein TatC
MLGSAAEVTLAETLAWGRLFCENSLISHRLLTESAGKMRNRTPMDYTSGRKVWWTVSRLLRIRVGSGDEARMTLVEHLDELRSRIIKAGAAFVIAAVAAWFFREQVFEWLLVPAPALEGSLNFTGVTGPIMADLKISLYVGLVVVIPIVFYQAWSFVAPAVGEAGRAFTFALIGFSSCLFLVGMAFGYFLVLPLALDFLVGWGGDRFEQIITAETYLSFVTRFLLGFGIAFEVPAAAYVGAKLGLVDAPLLKKYRRHAILANVLLAALLTPADPFSMVLMAVPLVVLYELSVLVARRVNPVPS